MDEGIDGHEVFAAQRLTVLKQAARAREITLTTTDSWTQFSPDGQDVTHWRIMHDRTADELHKELYGPVSRTLDGFDDCGRRVRPSKISLWKWVGTKLGLRRGLAVSNICVTGHLTRRRLADMRHCRTIDLG